MIPLRFEILKVGHCRQNGRMACRSARFRTVDFPALVGLLHHPDHGPILFDTGYASRFHEATKSWPERIYRMTTPVKMPPAEELQMQLQSRGIDAAKFQTIIVSHFHADHVCGLRDFPSARFICSKAGLDVVANATRFGGVRKGLLPALLPDSFAERAEFVERSADAALPSELAPFQRARDILGDGSVLAIDLPGHADGQFGIVFADADDRYVFLVADAAWSMQAVRDNALPMSIAGALLGHTKAYAPTLKRIHQLHRSNRDVLIVPSHCPERTKELVH